MTEAEPRPASTVLLVRESQRHLEVLLLRRPASGFAAGVWVFPGGAVDDDDYRLLPPSPEEPQRLAGRLGIEPGAAWAHLVAGIRETWEETGVLLDELPREPLLLGEMRRRLLNGEDSFSRLATSLGLRAPIASVAYLSRWVTPPTLPRRFDTHFFVAAAEAAEVSLVGNELEEARWLPVDEALAEWAAGTLALMPPTRMSLEAIAGFADARTLLAAIQSAEPRTYRPDLRTRDDRVKIAPDQPDDRETP